MLGDGGGAITVPEGAEPSTYWRDKGIVGGAIGKIGQGFGYLGKAGMAIMRPDLSIPTKYGEFMLGTDYDLDDIRRKGEEEGRKAREAVKERAKARRQKKAIKENETELRAGGIRAMPANDTIRMQLEALLGVPLEDATDEELVEVFDSL